MNLVLLLVGVRIGWFQFLDFALKLSVYTNSLRAPMEFLTTKNAEV